MPVETLNPRAVAPRTLLAVFGCRTSGQTEVEGESRTTSTTSAPETSSGTTSKDDTSSTSGGGCGSTSTDPDGLPDHVPPGFLNPLDVGGSSDAGGEASAPAFVLDAVDSTRPLALGSAVRAPARRNALAAAREESEACTPGTDRCCAPYCDLTNPDYPEGRRTCMPIYAPGEAPVGTNDVGFCGGPS